MTELENKITELVIKNSWLMEAEKGRYLGAMLLMSPEKQQKLMALLQKFLANAAAIAHTVLIA